MLQNYPQFYEIYCNIHARLSEDNLKGRKIFMELVPCFFLWINLMEVDDGGGLNIVDNNYMRNTWLRFAE